MIPHEKLVNIYQAIRRYIQKTNNLHSHSHEDLGYHDQEHVKARLINCMMEGCSELPLQNKRNWIMEHSFTVPCTLSRMPGKNVTIHVKFKPISS